MLCGYSSIVREIKLPNAGKKDLTGRCTLADLGHRERILGIVMIGHEVLPSITFQTNAIGNTFPIVYGWVTWIPIAQPGSLADLVPSVRSPWDVISVSKIQAHAPLNTT